MVKHSKPAYFVILNLKISYLLAVATALLSNSRKTKHHGLVPHPCVTKEYQKYATSIEMHNHYHTGSCGFEDVWHQAMTTIIYGLSH